jgi:hypothetical protein
MSKKILTDAPYLGGLIGTVEAYNRGYDCGINGPNDWNCNFRIFNDPANTKEWERGKADAENKNKRKLTPKPPTQ